MWYLCFQSISPSLTSCQLSRILALMEKWSNPVWKILFLKATPGTGKLPILCLCQNALSMEGSRQIFAKWGQQGSFISWDDFCHYCCLGNFHLPVGSDGDGWRMILFVYFVVDGFGFSERQTKGRVNWKNCQTENRKVARFWDNLADGLVLPLR